MDAKEFNFDGLVGPSHNYAGLSYGNVASAKHQGQASMPKAAALQGLAKMRLVASWGIGQGVLPPLPRPRLSLLRNLGFSGSPGEMVEAAFRADPALVAACFSASNMWTANAATVSPSADSSDRRVHFTPANLGTLLHRAIEADQTYAVLKAIFSDASRFQVHSPLLASNALTDEGAANHTRLCERFDSAGLQLFVFGRSALRQDLCAPTKYPARQTLESCHAIARRHMLSNSNAVFVQQNPNAIEAGVFHNDVISVGTSHLLLVHEWAFVDQDRVLKEIKTHFSAISSRQLIVLEIGNDELPIQDAVSSYLFNSVLLKRDDQSFTLVCPTDCRSNPHAFATLQRIVSADDNPITHVEYLDLRQSMNNGGGPACLRLRVVLNPAEQEAMHSGVIWSSELDQSLKQWVNHHYRETLSPDDLRDPKLLIELADASAALARILDLPIELFLDREFC